MYKRTGFISFGLRRFTGVALVLYLFMHMLVIGSATARPAPFDATFKVVHEPPFKILETPFIPPPAYHPFDGVRLLLVHYFTVREYRKGRFFAMFAVFVLVPIGGGVLIVLFMLKG